MRDLTNKLGIAAVVTTAFALSLTLHLGLLAGLGEQRGRPMIERGGELITDECMMGCVPVQLTPMAAEGTATVQCLSNGRGYVRDCRWLSESAAGWGDEAVDRLNSYGKIYSPEGRVRGSVTFELSMCVGLCPVY